eukprot:TRINITY_DN3324_c0_g1_i1.p1 TRINITY_DN3324_c0_g1~~TRINITY_DN3324_c0_g1_i1.p1  ORF type:complete len:382 (+),score=60.85 TRINITY_DN3324_c0_g1_i1:38-1183(+)
MGEAIKFIKENLESWRDIPSDKIKIELLPFGGSRKSYKVTAPDTAVSPDTVLLREFTHYSSLLKPNDKLKESIVFQKLSSYNLGPKHLGQNNQYRLEEFFKYSRPIQNTEINQEPIRRKLAIKLAKIHSATDLVPRNLVGENFITDLLDDQKFMLTVKENCTKCVEEGDNAEIVKELSQIFKEEEISFIKKLVQSEQSTCSHNDIWCGNILIQFRTNENVERKVPNVLFIDYETFEFNFPGYDIGKLLAETMYAFKPGGYSYDLRHDLYPTDNQIIDFLKFYLLSFGGHEKTFSESDIDEIVCFSEKQIDSVLETVYGSEENVKVKVSEWMNKVKKGAIVSAFYCVLLGMWIGRNPDFKTDFIKFAADGYSIYKRFRIAEM